METALRGACACGRNRYVVEMPEGFSQHAKVLFDSSNATRRHLANPLTPWLRIPLPWFRSYTFAQYPDETPLTIQRVFYSAFGPYTRRQFCGYCGTQLTCWNEHTADDAEHISLTLGSVLDEDLIHLERVGLLPGESDSENDEAAAIKSQHHGGLTISRLPQSRGTPWFEQLVEGSHLGRWKKQRGGHTLDHGRITVEWEISEWSDGDSAENEIIPSKRKLGDVDDAEMKA